jgi:hypothetical protein
MSEDSNESTSSPSSSLKQQLNRIDNNDADRERPSVLSTIASYIIVTEFCERLAYYGFAGSLVLFFQTILKYRMLNQTYNTQRGVGCVTLHH